MGNEQSTPVAAAGALAAEATARGTPRNKLSKPRTNSFANANGVPTNGKTSASPSRRGSVSGNGGLLNNRFSMVSIDVGEVADSLEGKGKVNTKEEPVKKKRMSIFRSRSSKAKVPQSEVNNEVATSPEDKSPVKKIWRRSNSVTENGGQKGVRDNIPVESSRPPPRTARMSLQHVPYSQHHARLSLVQEAPSPQPDSDRQLRIQNGDSQMSETLSTRTNSDTNLYAPIRRRSLLQHGVATRNSWAEYDPRSGQRNSPIEHRKSQYDLQNYTQEDMQNYYYNPSRPTSSPLSNLANMAIEMPAYIAPGPRVPTPDDLDYGHIGAYKLGTLRITNGAVSPAPSIERPGTTGDDYTIAAEARGTHGHGQSQRPNTSSVPPSTIKPPWLIRAESPLRQEFEVKPTPPDAERQEHLTLGTHASPPELALFKFTDHSPTKSLELAKDYITDLTVSPFSFDLSPPASPKLEATSKHTALEDELFEAEPETPTRRSTDLVFSSNQQTESQKVRGSQNTPKPLSKADSGYSSNVSLRSLRGKQAPPTENKGALMNAPMVRVPSSSYSEASTAPNAVRVPSSSYSVASAPSAQAGYGDAGRALPEVPARSFAVLPHIQTQRHSQAPVIPSKHLARHPDSPRSTTPPPPQRSPDRLLGGTSGKLSKTPKLEKSKSKTTLSEKSIPSASDSQPTSRWRSKSRSSQPGPTPVSAPFTVQAFRTASEELRIPPVPAAASRQLEARVDKFPGGTFPNTYHGDIKNRDLSARQASKETMTTILSVGSAEWGEEQGRNYGQNYGQNYGPQDGYNRLETSLPPRPKTVGSFRPPPASQNMAGQQLPRVQRTAKPISIHAPPPRSQTTSALAATHSHPQQHFQQQASGLSALLRPEYLDPKAFSAPRSSLRHSIGPGPVHAKPSSSRYDFETDITSYDTISESLGRDPYSVARPQSYASRDGVGTGRNDVRGREFARSMSGSNYSQAVNGRSGSMNRYSDVDAAVRMVRAKSSERNWSLNRYSEIDAAARFARTNSLATRSKSLGRSQLPSQQGAQDRSRSRSRSVSQGSNNSHDSQTLNALNGVQRVSSYGSMSRWNPFKGARDISGSSENDNSRDVAGQNLGQAGMPIPRRKTESSGFRLRESPPISLRTKDRGRARAPPPQAHNNSLARSRSRSQARAYELEDDRPPMPTFKSTPNLNAASGLGFDKQQAQVQESWAAQKQFWAERKLDAKRSSIIASGEAIPRPKSAHPAQARRSMYAGGEMSGSGERGVGEPIPRPKSAHPTQARRSMYASVSGGVDNGIYSPGGMVDEEIPRPKSAHPAQKRRSMYAGGENGSSREVIGDGILRPKSAHPARPITYHPPLPTRVVSRHASFENGPRQSWAQGQGITDTQNLIAGYHQYPSLSPDSHLNPIPNTQNPRQVSDSSWTSRVYSEWESDAGTYDHTYGSYHATTPLHSQPPSRSQSRSASFTRPRHNHANQPVPNGLDQSEYYDSIPAPQTDGNDAHKAQEQEARVTRALTRSSTSDMLVLDRYGGGLGFDVGLGSSAGMNVVPGARVAGVSGKSSKGKGMKERIGGVGEQYGIDFSDVPVILQRVRVRG